VTEANADEDSAHVGQWHEELRRRKEEYAALLERLGIAALE